MSVALDIAISDHASEALKAKLAAIQPSRAARIAGPAMRECWRDALAALPSNKKGWPSTKFWERASRSVQQPDYSEDTVTLTAQQQGLRQRWLGGPITATDKALTIPISAQSYGLTASQVPGLFMVVTKKGAYLARYGEGVDGQAAHKARRGTAPVRAALQFMFKLIARGSSVQQQGNPAVVPQEKIVEAGLNRLSEVLA